MAMFLLKHGHVLQADSKYMSEEYLRGFPAAVTAASSGEEDPGPSMPAAEVMPRRDRSLTRSPSPMQTEEVQKHIMNIFSRHHAHDTYLQTPLTGEAAVTELLKSLDTNNNGTAVATVKVLDGAVMKDVPVVRIEKKIKVFFSML